MGKHTYALLGIFKEDESFAVLIQQSIETKKRIEMKVVLNQKIGPYSVANISTSTIVFVQDNKKIELSLFNH